MLPTECEDKVLSQFSFIGRRCTRGGVGWIFLCNFLIPLGLRTIRGSGKMLMVETRKVRMFPLIFKLVSRILPVSFSRTVGYYHPKQDHYTDLNAAENPSAVRIQSVFNPLQYSTMQLHAKTPQ